MVTSTKKPATPRKSGSGKATTSKSKSSATKLGGRWGTAAIVGGVALVGAAAAALLALRGSTPVDPEVEPDAMPDPGEKAHQADETDQSVFFRANSADQGTISE